MRSQSPPSQTPAFELKTLKKADLEKSKGKKIDRQMNQSATSGRFGHVAVDRREQRKRDQALGLVPFAIKLDRERPMHVLCANKLSSCIVCYLFRQHR